MTEAKATFFTHDKHFYKTLFSMMTFVALQNLLAYSVNMADNIMLGSYSEYAMSGAATVNQVFFVLQTTANALATAVVALCSQYWGKQTTGPIRAVTGVALKAAALLGIIFWALSAFLDEEILGIFTTSDAILAEGVKYIKTLKWTFILFSLSTVLMAALRSVGTVNISFCTSAVSLVLNVGINYTLIFGRFGFPEMGVAGAAIGTLISRCVELGIIVFYLAKMDKKIRLFSAGFLRGDGGYARDYGRVLLPMMISSLVWAISVPMQTAILGHLSDAAIAANSVATTFYQYLKVFVQAMTNVSAVMIGNAIGRGSLDRIKSDARSLTAIDMTIGVILAAALYLLRAPLMSLYNLSDETTALAMNLLAVMSLVMLGMAYQYPVHSGIIQGGGDAKFVMNMNLISIWVIVMPLSFLSAFVWHWPVEAVVLVIQSDQIFKSLPTFIRFRSYKWIKTLTR